MLFPYVQNGEQNDDSVPNWYTVIILFSIFLNKKCIHSVLNLS